MKYQTIDGIIYDIEAFTSEEKKLFEGLYNYSLTAPHWSSVMQPHIYHRAVIETAMAAIGERWQEHPLYRINLDLMSRIGVRHGDLKQPEKPFPDPILEE
ncbi:hypothetical protein HZA98_00455 [Candidatus Woesearchaeota archaeon]|nr:hypothetical protein [Candidatus Woesearchaeota archaeon]